MKPLASLVRIPLLVFCTIFGRRTVVGSKFHDKDRMIRSILIISSMG